MPDFFDAHRGTIDRAVEAISARTYWSAFPEHPKAYGEDAPGAGQEAFDAMRGHPFTLDQKNFGYGAVAESSPYGLELGIEYPSTTVDATIEGAVAAMRTWGRATPETRAGACLEILDRLSKDSFTMAHAVMHTTGQSFLMAFQAGGPHALDRALEAVAYAYQEQTRIPDPLRWEKPQGQREPLVIDKRWIIRPRGVAVAIGVSTFPTWNGYPGIFASLAAGNPVIVKPHPGTILPFAILVRTARAVMAEAGFDPDVIQLLVDTPDSPVAKDLVMRPEVGIVDYTGGSAFGRWLEEHATHADVYTEKAGVNSVILDSVRDLSAVLRNLSVSMTMYSGQMCTTPQNLFIPASGVKVGDEVVPYDEVVAAFVAAVDGLLGDDARAAGVLGAIKGEATIERVDGATSSGRVLSASRVVVNEEFPEAVVRTPVILEVDATADAHRHEMFGPIIYVVRAESTRDAIVSARSTAIESGAITWLAYATDDAVIEEIIDAAVDGGVSVAFNLAGGLFVNQSAAFSDFHVTGANPAGNASLADPAFVAKRFRVVGVRIEPAA
ncbi:MAG TPA: phenylacetic acid degradation protein PaaN [Acidimicrobiia bacterium]|nr:phenylacetic acid degradation protein PaaN [Acidimicrobiia bacterium]